MPTERDPIPDANRLYAIPEEYRPELAAKRFVYVESLINAKRARPELNNLLITKVDFDLYRDRSGIPRGSGNPETMLFGCREGCGFFHLDAQGDKRALARYLERLFALTRPNATGELEAELDKVFAFFRLPHSREWEIAHGRAVERPSYPAKANSAAAAAKTRREEAVAELKKTARARRDGIMKAVEQLAHFDVPSILAEQLREFGYAFTSMNMVRECEDVRRNPAFFGVQRLGAKTLRSPYPPNNTVQSMLGLPHESAIVYVRVPGIDEELILALGRRFFAVNPDANGALKNRFAVLLRKHGQQFAFETYRRLLAVD